MRSTRETKILGYLDIRNFLILLNILVSFLLISLVLRTRRGISHRLRLAFLPSSLIICLPITLVYSTCPPVSVCGTEKYMFSTPCGKTMRLFLETERDQIAPSCEETFICSSIKTGERICQSTLI